MEVENVFVLHEILVLDDAALVLRLQDANLIKTNFRCRVVRCRRYCTIQRREGVVLGQTFRCPGCRKFYSILTGSFFSRIRIPIRIVLYSLWNWACEIRTGSNTMSVGVSRVAGIQMFRFFRDICSWKLLQEDFLLGGDGAIVQIDESVLTKRKYHRGRRVKAVWVLGMYDTRAKKGYIQIIPNRTADTLENVIVKYVRPGTEIWTDQFRGYLGLKSLGGVSPYTHKTVNHSRFFRDPDTGVCTNYVEGYWSRLKGYLRRLSVMASPFLPEYVDQFMWSERFGPTASHRFSNLILHISERYPV